MGFHFRLVGSSNHEKRWNEHDHPLVTWGYFFKPPWLMIIHLLQIAVLFAIFLMVIQPTIKTTFLIRNFFSSKLCPDTQIDEPFASYEDIAEFFDSFKDNLDALLHRSFMEIVLVNTFDPYHFILTYDNGTTVQTQTVDIDLHTFRHLDQMVVGSSFFSIMRNSEVQGCTKWNVFTEIKHSLGSYAFTAAPAITRDPCPTQFLISKGIDEDPPMMDNLRTLSFCLFVLSLCSSIVLLSSLVRRWRSHQIWRTADSVYKDLPIYDQIHLSLGFWHPIHFIVSLVLFISSIVLLMELPSKAQFMSFFSLRWYACAFFLTFCAACRWFIYTPKLYQLINVVRVSFTRLLSITIGMMPIVFGIMFAGLFLFGLVSDITKSYVRFFQLYIGQVFGDDLFASFTYYTDGSDLYTTLSFFYVTILTIVATYITFPAYTATISFLRQHEVVPVEEQKIN